MDESVELADAIAALREQLGRALREGGDEAVHFRLGPVELEFGLSVKRDRKGEGGVKFWVVTLGVQGSASEETQHRVKLTLNPVDAAGADLDVRSELPSRPR
jgi:hypothetical protein